jgi:hypothetical protein
MEEEFLNLLKKALDERVERSGAKLFDLVEVNSLALEMGLDVGRVKRIFEEINGMLQDRVSELRGEDNLP